MIVTLIRIDAADASGSAVPVFLASHDRPEACHLGGQQWDAALAVLPDFALDFFGGAFAGQVTAPRTTFAVATTRLAAFGSSAATRARFAEARVRIWIGDDESAASADLGPLTLRFDGRLTAEPEIDEATRTARFEAAVKDAWADKPLLALFAGTGGIEGPADLTGQVKPLVLGNARFCGGVLIDRVDNVYMVSNGAVQAVNAVYDRLVSLGASAGDYADLAALKAASVPNGGWATCLAQGLVRLGAPPDGRLSFDVSGSNAGAGGYVRTPGAIIRRIADLAGGTVATASLARLDAARPYNLALQLREQVTPREAIGQLADSVAAVAGVGLTGALFAEPLGFGTPSDTLAADDSGTLPVAAVEELAKGAPAWRLATEAELTFEVHSADEAAFEYRWQGEYSPARVYRIDDVVTGPDSAAWVYINATAAAGQALPVWPVTSNSYWRLFQAPGGAGITIVDGVIEGIATPDVPVDNRLNLLRDTLSNLPGTGEFIGQQFFATDTKATLIWSGALWVDGTDLTLAVSGPAEVPLAYAADLTLTSPLPVTATYTLVAAGGGPLASAVTWAVSVVSGTFAGTAPSIVGTGSGQLRINSGLTSPTAELRITASVAGRTYPPFTVKVARNVAVPIASGGAVTVGDALTSITGTSFVRMHSADLVITLNPGVTSVALVAAGDLLIAPTTPTGSTTVEGKWQREVSPGTWSDVGSVATSAPLPNVYDTGLVDGSGAPVYAADPGSISCNRTASGLTAGSTYKFRFVARISAGNVRTVTGSGNVSATA